VILFIKGRHPEDELHCESKKTGPLFYGL